MVSFWGSKNGEEQQDDQEQEGEHSSAPPPRRQQEPDERSRLLPPHNGYLSPDDPAVSLTLLARHTMEIADTSSRSLPTTSGVSERFATFPSSSS